MIINHNYCTKLVPLFILIYNIRSHIHKIRILGYFETTLRPTQAPIPCVQGDFVSVRASETMASGNIHLESGI